MKIIFYLFIYFFITNTLCAQYGKCFAPQLLHGTSGTALQIVSADFNNDNNADAVITNFTTNNIDIQLNAFASGNFSPSSYTTSSGPTSSAVGDIDNDGDIDVVVAGNSTNINVLKNNGSGAFTTYTTNTTTYSNFSHSLLFDMNNDGNLDLVLSAQSGAIVTMLGNGFGNFTTNTSKVLGGSGGRMVVYDFNADGKKDVVIVEASVNKIEQLLGNGTGGFLTTTYTTTVGNSSQDIICADLNYDGVNDVAVANYNSNNMSILYTNSGGALPTVNATVTFPSNYFPQTMATGDFNNDSKADIVMGFNVSSKIGVLLNDALGSFQAPIYFSPTATPRGVVVGKFDAGATLDFACVYQSSSQMQSWLNNLAPNVVASISTPTVCSGNQVTVNSTGANTYTWSNGVTNNIAFTPMISETYTVTGTNTVTSCTSTNTVSISVVSSPTINLTSSSSSSICANATATLNASGSLGISYLWAHNSSTNTSVVVSPGTYTLQGSSGICSVTKTITVFSYPSFSVNITPSSTVICTPGNVTLTATGASTYGWVRPTNMSENGNSIVGSDAGTYTLTGFVSGCSLTTTISLNAYTKPNVSIVSLPVNTLTGYYCSGQTVTVTANGAPAYNWSNGGINNTFTTTTSGNYTVTGNNNGCVNSATITINILPTPTLSGVFSNTIGACSSNSITLNANGATYYQWNNGVTSTSSAYSIKPTVNSTYTLTGYSNGYYCETTKIYTVNVISAPTFSVVDMFYQPLTQQCSGSNITVAISNTNVTTPNWSNGGQGLMNTYMAMQSNSAVQSVTVTDNASNCVTVQQFTVPLFPQANLQITPSSSILCAGQVLTFTGTGATTYTWSNNNNFTGNTYSFTASSMPFTGAQLDLAGHDANGCFIATFITISTINCTTSVLDIDSDKKDFKIYPNPTLEILTIEFENLNDEPLVSIINTLGEIVLSEKQDVSQSSFNIKHLKSGIYYIKVETKNGWTTKKFIKQ